MRPAWLRSHWGRSGRSTHIPRGPSSCSRDRTATTRAVSSSPGSGCRPAYDRGMSWHDWVRGEEIEPSLYGADFSRLGDQIDALLAAGCRIFHFDVGDGHFVEPVTMGPIVLQWISPRIHDAGGAVDVHLMVERPAKYFGAVRKAGGDSVTFHY